MARPAFFRMIETREQLKKMLDSGMTKTDIAAEFGIDLTVLRREIKRGTRDRELSGSYDPILAQARYMAASEETMIFDTPQKLHWLGKCLEANLSFDEIAKLFGCTPYTVRDTIIRVCIQATKDMQ